MIMRFALLALLTVAPALPQCAMCRDAAASQRIEAIEALNSGILLLGAPPAIILAVIGGLAWRRR